MIAGDATDGRELLVTPGAGADVAGIDPVLVESGRARRIAREQQVTVVVKITDERNIAAGVGQPA